MKVKSQQYPPTKAKVDCRNISIRLTQSQQALLRRESKKRGWRIRDLISRSVKFYLANEANNEH